MNKNTKVEVSQEASDRKRNLRMPEKRGFLVPKRNSSLPRNTSSGRTFFLQAASRQRSCWLSTQRCATSPACSSEAHDRSSINNLRKIIPLSSLNALSGSGQHFHHRIVVNPKIKFQSKRYSCIFSFVLNLLTASTDKRRQVNGLRRRKEVNLLTSKFPNNTNNSPHMKNPVPPYIEIYQIVLIAQIPLTLSRYPSLSAISFSRSSKVHSVSAQNCFLQSANTSTSMCRSPLEKVAYEFVLQQPKLFW